MTPGQKRIVIGLLLAAVLGWLTAPFWGVIGKADMPVSHAPLVFNADQAYQITREFVTRNPKRVLGSIEARQATGYLRDSLKRLGYQLGPPSYFDAVIAGRRQVGNNIVAFKAGALPGLIAVMAHYDTARTTVQGAMDDGSGIGVMLELARVFADAPLRHGLLIVASDGEEWGMLGAADLAGNYPERRRIAAVLSLDGVNIGDLAQLRLDTEGQRSGYSPSWLRRISLQAAQRQGLPVASPAGLEEQFQRAICLSHTDQGPLLNAGIPAINLGSRSVDERRARAVYHSENDTILNLKPAGIGTYGQAAERILRSIDELPSIPGMDNSFRWENDTYIAAWAMTALQIMAFLPFFAMLAFAWVQNRERLTAAAILRESAFFISGLAPFLLMFALILLCRLLRFIPHNSLYPGPLKDPILDTPAWGVVAIIAAVCIGMGIGLHFGAGYLMQGRRPTFGAAKTVLLIFLLIVLVLGLAYDSYWASTFLLFPALIWGAVGRGRSVAARIAGALAIVAAGFMLYAQAAVYERSLGAGLGMIWYTVLGLSNGMLIWKGYVLAACAIVLGLRFLSLQLSRREPRG